MALLKFRRRTVSSANSSSPSSPASDVPPSPALPASPFFASTRPFRTSTNSSNTSSLSKQSTTPSSMTAPSINGSSSVQKLSTPTNAAGTPPPVSLHSLSTAYTVAASQQPSSPPLRRKRGLSRLFKTGSLSANQPVDIYADWPDHLYKPWEHPPLKYKRKADPKFVAMLEAWRWDWNEEEAQRSASWVDGVSPGQSRRGSIVV